MMSYTYKAVSQSGTKTKGYVKGVDEQDALRRITAMGLTPLKVSKAVQKTSKATFSWQQVKPADIVGLTRELAVLVEARVPIDRGMVSIAEGDCKPDMRTMLLDMAAMIESGLPMTQALEKYKHIFGNVFIETVRAAEKSGSMVEVMNHLAELLEKQMETTQQLKRAMTYPVIVLSVVFVAVTVIIVFVVPKFGAIFESQGAQLPITTRVVQALGDSVRAYWWAYVGAIVGFFTTIVLMWKNPVGRLKLENFLLEVPYVRKIILAVTAGRFARVMGIGMQSGLDIIEAVQMGARATGRPVFINDCNAMVDQLRQGTAIQDVLRGTRYLPSFARRMIGAGKDSADLARSCDVVARYYDREASHLTKNVNTIIEPIMTVAMAGIVLLVALSVFLPMWGMVRLQK
jgi:type II secretory pathway component PulF